MRVIISACDIAPRPDRWMATERDYDLDIPVGHGATPLEAIATIIVGIVAAAGLILTVSHIIH